MSVVDFYLNERVRIRKDSWSREELEVVAQHFRVEGPKGTARRLPNRTSRAVAAVADRMGLTTDMRPGPRPLKTEQKLANALDALRRIATGNVPNEHSDWAERDYAANFLKEFA